MELYRPLLRLMLRGQLADQWAGKIDLSGVVQQTLLEAHANERQFSYWGEDQRVAWLRRALFNNLRDELRKRKLTTPEVSLDQAADSAATLADIVAADHSSPAQRATRNESLMRLANALEQLPADQRRAVELHHLDGLTISQTAEQMGKTVQSVVGLVFRGLKQLKSEMHPE